MTDDVTVTREYQLQTRRHHIGEKGFTEWRTVFTGDSIAAFKERQAHLDSGYASDRLRVVRVTILTEVC